MTPYLLDDKGNEYAQIIVVLVENDCEETTRLFEYNFKKLMIDFYSIFAEKYKLNPTDGWKDAFEETFGLSLEDFYSDF